MPRSTAWKQLERTTAKALGGKRNPAAKGDGGPDVVGVPGWVIEAKYRATFAHDTLYHQEKKKRARDLRKGRARFLLVTRARAKEPLVVISLADFRDLMGLGNGDTTDPEPQPHHLGQGMTLPGLDTTGPE